MAVSKSNMARLASPFGLPPVGVRGAPVALGAPHFVILVAGIALIALCVGMALFPYLFDAFDRREVREYRAAFGYTVGDVPAARGLSYWGVTSVMPGSPADRAGLRRHDVMVGDSGSLLWAVQEASAGRRACIEVRNVDDERVGGNPVRTVCF
jgi:hypothetical protein